MKKIGIIFGGRSVEHDVSVISAHQVIENINKDKYEIIPIYITKTGNWLTGKQLFNLKNFNKINLSKLKKIYISPNDSNPFFINTFLLKKILKIDIILPVMHGTYGEDGCLQGLLELLNIPYVGARVIGSSVGMDKIIMKDVFKSNNLPVLNYVWFFRSKWENKPDEVINEIEKKIKYPVFTKPANLGSSIGINKSNNREELKFAIDVASNYDSKIIVEQSIEKGREINCSVLGSNDEVIASVCEEPIKWQEFLSFEDKYLNKTKGLIGANRRIPAQISKELTLKIQDLAIKSFKAIDCKGIARIDFLIDKNEEPFVNEINTIPGSLAFYLWQESKLNFSELLNKLIELGFETYKEKNKTNYNYETKIFKGK